MVPTLGDATLQVPVSGWDSTVTPKAAPSATLTGKVNGMDAPGELADGVGDTTSLPFDSSSPVDFRPLTTPPSGVSVPEPLTSTRPLLVRPTMAPLSSMLPPPLPPHEASTMAQSRARPE